MTRYLIGCVLVCWIALSCSANPVEMPSPPEGTLLSPPEVPNGNDTIVFNNSPDVAAALPPVSIKHGDHAHKVHTIQVVPLTSAKLLEEAKEHKDIERSHQSGKCVCDALLIAEKSAGKDRTHVSNVYANKLEFKTCDADEQKSCRDFCLLQTKQSEGGLDAELDGKSVGQQICDKIKRDESNRKVALFSTVECAGHTAGFVAFKKVSKWTNFVYPMKLSCENGKHKLESVDKNAEQNHPDVELDGAEDNVRDRVLISTEIPEKMQADESVPATEEVKEVKKTETNEEVKKEVKEEAKTASTDAPVEAAKEAVSETTTEISTEQPQTEEPNNSVKSEEKPKEEDKEKKQVTRDLKEEASDSKETSTDAPKIEIKEKSTEAPTEAATTPEAKSDASTEAPKIKAPEECTEQPKAEEPKATSDKPAAEEKQSEDDKEKKQVTRDVKEEEPAKSKNVAEVTATEAPKTPEPKAEASEPEAVKADNPTVTTEAPQAAPQTEITTESTKPTEAAAIVPDVTTIATSAVEATTVNSS